MSAQERRDCTEAGVGDGDDVGGGAAAVAVGGEARVSWAGVVADTQELRSPVFV